LNPLPPLCLHSFLCSLHTFTLYIMSMAAPAAGKITLLTKLSCAIFGNVYNPQNLRTGNKILRQRLVGPTINAYYPNVKQLKLREITRMAPEMNLVDQVEKTRLEDLSERKKRGKGPPKKGKHNHAPLPSSAQQIDKRISGTERTSRSGYLLNGSIAFYLSTFRSGSSLDSWKEEVRAWIRTIGTPLENKDNRNRIGNTTATKKKKTHININGCSLSSTCFIMFRHNCGGINYVQQ
jgi:small subunit ribosomal protein S33